MSYNQADENRRLREAYEDLLNSEMANAIENSGDEHGLQIAQWLHGEYWYGELGEPGSVQVWIDQKAPDGDIYIHSPNLGRRA